MHTITVIKLNILGEETWRYSGRVLHRSTEYVILEALFNRPDIPFHGVLLREGDRFIEKFYNNRWYNVFAVHDRDDDQLKCWYCNVTKPTEIKESTVIYCDLALDLLVYPDGRQLVLDEDEFAALQLSDQDKHLAENALAELQVLFSKTPQPDILEL